MLFYLMKKDIPGNDCTGERTDLTAFDLTGFKKMSISAKELLRRAAYFHMTFSSRNTKSRRTNGFLRNADAAGYSGKRKPGVTAGPPGFSGLFTRPQSENPKKYYFSPYFFIDSCREIPRMGGDV